jgi:hypothetical protein
MKQSIIQIIQRCGPVDLYFRMGQAGPGWCLAGGGGCRFKSFFFFCRPGI